MPKILQKYVVNGSKAYLLHPRMDCTKNTISQYHYWLNLREAMHTCIKLYMNFHKNMKQSLKYGLLPAKEVYDIPWDR